MKPLFLSSQMCVQFDRSTSRNKAAADQILCGLEEVLSSMQPTNSFVDEAMLRYRVSYSFFKIKNVVFQQQL